MREDDLPPGEKLCRELLRRFQAAINGLDVPAMMLMLGDEQPLSVLASRRVQACANDASYALALAG